MSQLIEFYRGIGSDARGRNLERIWAYWQNATFPDRPMPR